MKRNCGTVEHMEMKLRNDNVYKRYLEEIEKYIEQYAKNNKNQDNLVITIPAVVHVVYNINNQQQNISYQQVLTQLQVMNEDFRRHNRDTINTPPPFKPLGADIQVEFCPARRDPSNNPSIGVTRTATTVTEFGLDDAVKFNATGGHDAWDRDKYLNIWVCNLQATLLGYAEFPGGPASTDGVVIDYQAFGTIGTAASPYNLGRTATHEVGHWLNLYHIWGDDNGACWGSDQVDDTPNQASEFYGCPSYPRLDAC
ncbi:MAG TPA: M43 family zinc metalloprotease, partial [Ignavibacteria bacterium]